MQVPCMSDVCPGALTRLVCDTSLCRQWCGTKRNSLLALLIWWAAVVERARHLLGERGFELLFVICTSC